MKIKLTDITIDPAVAIRQGTDEDTIQRYMDTFAELPPIVIFHTDHQYLLADGFHRWAAASRLGHTDIEYEVRKGSYEAATEYAIYANLKHGKPLSREEYKDAVRRLHILHPDWGLPRLASAIIRSEKFIETTIKSDKVQRLAMANLDDRVNLEISRAPQEMWHEIAQTAKEQGWTVEQTANIVAILKTQPDKLAGILNIPKAQLSQTLDATLAEINHKTKEAVTAIQPEIKTETPEDLRNAAKILYKEAAKREKVDLTPEQIEVKKQDREAKQQERAQKAKHIAETLDPAVRQAILEKEVERNPTYVKRADRNIKRKKTKDKLDAKKQQALSAYPNAGIIPIYTGDISLLYDKVKDSSVDLVFTDPPYGEDNLVLFEELAELAKAKLKDGGLCLTYAPHAHLDIILATMTRHLDYWWILGINQTGAEARIWEKHLWVGWKPILAFIKQPGYKVDRLTDEWVRDWYRGTGGDKEHHEWGQPVDEASYWIEAFTLGNGQSLVLDPFCGGGTIPLACVLTERNYVAIDKDPRTAAMARKRITDWQKRQVGE